MGLNIDKVKIVKNNGLFFLLCLFLLNLHSMNVCIFESYWEEKLYQLELRTGEHQHWSNQTTFSFSDYEKYGGTYYEYIPFMPFILYYRGIFLYILLGVLFFCYVILPLLFILSQRLLEGVKYLFIFIDCIVLLILIRYSIGIASHNPKMGVIPLYILIPILLFILIAFRIYQYMKKLIFKS